MKCARVFVVPVVLLFVLASCSSKEQSPVALSPEATVEQIAHGLADGELQVAWEMLPESYQRDVSRLVHQAAAEMDAEMWNQSFRVLGKFTRVLSEKKQFILEHPMVAAQVKNRGEADAQWDAVVGVFDTLVQSELADLGKLERLDIEAFLAGTGTEMMGRMAEASKLSPDDPFAEQMENLRATRVTPLAQQDDSARVRIETPGQPAREEELLLVEGKWIPKSLADGWSEEIRSARESVARLSDDGDPAARQGVLMQLTMVEAALDGVLQTRSAEEFQASVGAVMGMAMGALMTQASAAGGAVDQVPTVEAAAPLSMKPGQDAVAFRQPAAAVDADRRPEAASAPRRSDLDTRIATEDAADFLGVHMRATGTDGMNVVGKLTEVGDGFLVFERETRAGQIAFEIAVDEIASLHVLDR